MLQKSVRVPAGKFRRSKSGSITATEQLNLQVGQEVPIAHRGPKAEERDQSLAAGKAISDVTLVP
jgi:hypothetical protein